MNWKKEGYVVGQTVYLVVKTMYGSLTRHEVGIVSHVGTKLLKVKCNPKMLLTYRDDNYCYGNLGLGYYVYKSKEHYQEEIDREVNRKLTIELIKDELSDLSLEELEEISKLISKETRGTQNGKENNTKTDC